MEAKILLAVAYSVMSAMGGALAGAVGILFGLPTWLAVGGGVVLAVIATIAWMVLGALGEADRLVRFAAPVDSPDPARVCAPPSDLPPAHRRGLALAVSAACACAAGIAGAGSLIAGAVLAVVAMSVAAVLHRAPVLARAGYAASSLVGSVVLLFALAWYFEGRSSYFRIELVIPLVIAAAPMLLVYAVTALVLDRRAR